MNLKRRLISMLLCISIISMMMPINVVAADGSGEYPESYTIYPTPHSIIYGDSGVKLENVNIVATENIDGPSKTNLEEVLKESGISYTFSEAMVDEKPNIVLGIKDDNRTIGKNFDALDLEDTSALDELEGYVLSVKDGNIFIMGSESIALYYGILTLKQIIKTSTSVRDILINDYSDTAIRGTVEGFYGIPWSHEARTDIFEMMGEYKMNMYVYAPKDDPYHFGKDWNKPYPKEELDELENLVKTADDNNVEFIYTLHISNDMDLSDKDDEVNAKLKEIPEWGNSDGDADRGKYVPAGQHKIDEYSAEETMKSFKAKFEQMYDIGVRRFGILADDISPYVGRYCIPYLINFMNELQDYFMEKYDDVEPLVFCPTYYYTKSVTEHNGEIYYEYIRHGADQKITKGLHKNIEIMWTGKDVMSDLKFEHNDFASKRFGREPLIWWNYPVNDYCSKYIMLGPNPGLYTDATNMSGILVNPMQQGFASEISLFGVADYAWNLDDYDTNKAWEDSFTHLFPEVADSLYLIAQHAISGYSYEMTNNTNVKESDYMRDTLKDFANAVWSDDSIKIISIGATLKAQLDDLLHSVNDVRKNCKSEGLVKDLNPWLDKLESVCLTGNAVIEAFTSDDPTEIWNNYCEANAEIKSWPSITVAQLRGDPVAAEIGSEFMTPYISTIFNALKERLNNLLLNGDKSTDTHSVFSNVKDLADTPVTVSENTYSISGLSGVSLGYSYFVGMKLDNNYLIDTITATVDDAKVFNSLEIQYSENEVDWTTLEGKVADNTFTASLDGKAARYVRVINTNTDAVEFDLSSMNITVAGAKPQTVSSATSTVDTQESNAASNLVDGKLDTVYLVEKIQAAGQAVIIEYDDTFDLYDYTIYGSEYDYIRKGSISVSTNGKEWQKIGSIADNYMVEMIDGNIYNVIYGNAGGAKTKYLKIETEGSIDRWTKIHELEINKTVDKETGVKNPFNMVFGGVTANAADGDARSSFSTTSDEGYLKYSLSEHTGASQLVILQDANNISNATVSILTSKIGWFTIGKLSKAYNSFNIERLPNILEVKLEWQDNDVTPVINEIFTFTTEYDITQHIRLFETVVEAFEAENEGTAAYKRLDKAVKYAQAVFDYSGATRKMYQDLTLVLQKALIADKDALRQLIGECLKLEKEDYTADSWALYEPYFNSAMKVLSDSNAIQEQVDPAYHLLTVARSMLVPLVNPEVDKVLLQLVVDLAKKAVESGEVDDAIQSVQDEFYNNFVRALAVLEEEKATQTEVDDAYNALSEMLNRLGFIKGDKDALQRMYDLLSQFDMKDYEAGEAKEAFKNAMVSAAKLLADGDAMRDEVDKAYTALMETRLGLKRLDITRLEKEVTTSEKIKESLDKYVKKGQSEFLAALESAKTVLAKEELTQAEIDAARTALATARANLRYKANKDVLKSLVVKAELIDLSQYTDESVALLRSALSTARMLLDDLTLSEEDQGQIDDAAAKVEKTIKDLDPKPTGTTSNGSTDNSGKGNSGSDSSSSDNATTGSSSKNAESKVAKTGDTDVVYVITTVFIALGLTLFVIHRRKKYN